MVMSGCQCIHQGVHEAREEDKQTQHMLLPTATATATASASIAAVVATVTTATSLSTAATFVLPPPQISSPCVSSP